jgi:hypothetical protein
MDIKRLQPERSTRPMQKPAHGRNLIDLAWLSRRKFSGVMLAVFVFATAFSFYALSPVPARAATANVVPNGDVTTNWWCNDTSSACTSAVAGTHYTHVDEDTSNLNTSDFVNTGTSMNAAAGIEEYTMGTIANIVSATQVQVFINVKTLALGSTADTLTINLRIAGTLVAGSTVTPSTAAYGWLSSTFSGSWTQSDIDGMQTQVVRNIVGSGSANSKDDNISLAATYSTVTYTPPPDFTQASHKWFGEPQQQAGVNWINRAPASNSAWDAVAYGNGLYVAVANSGGAVMTSPDGITWTSRSGITRGWRSIAYGNGRFVVVESQTGSGAAGQVMTSTDGITWASQTSAAERIWMSVTFAKGLFVAVAQSGTGDRVMTSPDGITWTSRATPTDSAWHSVTYGNGLFVAISQGSEGVANEVMTSPDGITWTTHTAAANNAWNSITYGNGLFVAVAQSGTGNRVMTSTDGIIWTSQTSTADYLWYTVTYGNGLFVAVALSGTGNRVMTSPDGVNWSARPSAADNSWQSVTYGNGMFVAVSSDGSGNQVMTSDSNIIPTAASWTMRNANEKQWENVVYANGKFVAVANRDTTSTDYFAISTDGYNWTTENGNSSSFSPVSIAYGNGLFVSVSYVSGFGVETSPDGITWTTRTSAADNSWNSVTYGNGLFVAVGTVGTGNRVMTSPDGITWTIRTSAADNSWRSVTNGNGLFVAVANSGVGNRVMTSPDGVVWTSRTSAADNSWYAVGYGNGLFVALTQNATSGLTSPVVMTAPAIDASVGDTLSSQDAVISDNYSDNVRLRMDLGVSTANASAGAYNFGLQYATRTGASCSNSETFYNVGTGPWSVQTAAATLAWQSVAYGNGLFVAVATSGTGNRVMTSPDGATWTSQTSAADLTWQSVTYGNGLFVAVANDSLGVALVMTSPDGINWTSRTTGSPTTWTSVTYGNGLYVAVSTSGINIMYSSDGISWTKPFSSGGPNIPFNSVTYANGLFVAVGTDSNGLQKGVMTSSDGISWSAITNEPGTATWQSVTYGNGLFVAVASTGQVMTSPDGLTWTIRTAAANNAWQSVAYGNGEFMAVSNTGTGNRVMTSSDGINWTSQTSAADSNWTEVAYGNNNFVAVASSGTNLIMSASPVVKWGGSSSNNYGTVTSSGSDPTQSGATIISQNYVTNNFFSNPNPVAAGQYGLYDFDLDISKATYESTYCFRIVKADGTLLTTYNTFPEITRCTVPTLNRRLRHGAAFCGGVKQFYWQTAGS